MLSVSTVNVCFRRVHFVVKSKITHLLLCLSRCRFLGTSVGGDLGILGGVNRRHRGGLQAGWQVVSTTHVGHQAGEGGRGKQHRRQVWGEWVQHFVPGEFSPLDTAGRRHHVCFQGHDYPCARNSRHSTVWHANEGADKSPVEGCHVSACSGLSQALAPCGISVAQGCAIVPVDLVQWLLLEGKKLVQVEPGRESKYPAF